MIRILFNVYKSAFNFVHIGKQERKNKILLNWHYVRYLETIINLLPLMSTWSMDDFKFNLVSNLRFIEKGTPLYREHMHKLGHAAIFSICTAVTLHYVYRKWMYSCMHARAPKMCIAQTDANMIYGIKTILNHIQCAWIQSGIATNSLISVQLKSGF